MKMTENEAAIPTMPSVARDSLGRPIEVGATISYPGRYSSSMWMNVGVVRAVEYGYDTWRKRGYHILQVERLEIKDEYARDRATRVFLHRKMVELSALERVVLLNMSEPELLRVLEQRIDREQERFDKMHQDWLEREQNAREKAKAEANLDV